MKIWRASLIRLAEIDVLVGCAFHHRDVQFQGLCPETGDDLVVRRFLKSTLPFRLNILIAPIYICPADVKQLLLFKAFGQQIAQRKDEGWQLFISMLLRFIYFFSNFDKLW